MTRGVTLRAAHPADDTFLLEVYASTRADELALVAWSQEDQRRFLRHQHDARETSYRSRYPDGQFLVVERDGRPIGRLVLGLLDGEVRVVDIALLPDERGAGIGSALLREVLSDADAMGARVSLHVDRGSPALRLYRRLGFGAAGGDQVTVLLVREPAARQLNTAS